MKRKILQICLLVLLATVLAMGCGAKQAKIDFGSGPRIAPPEMPHTLKPIIVGDPEEPETKKRN